MKYFMIFLFVIFSACSADDSPDINGNKVTDVPITEINSPQTAPPSNSTTPVPSTTPTPTKPHSSTTQAPTTVKPVTTDTPSTSSEKPPKTTIPTSSSTTTSTSTSTSKPNPTAAPIITTPAPHRDRKFDGPSFMGGIILALGLVAIAFVAFKFYKARTEMNYHTL